MYWSVQAPADLSFTVVEPAPTIAAFLEGNATITDNLGLRFRYVGNRTDFVVGENGAVLELARAKCQLIGRGAQNFGVHRVSGTYRGVGSTLHY